MSDAHEPALATDIGEYCRRVEEHLTRVNAGHLVRIVATGFALVRGWAEAGIPLSVVCRGIDMKAERHREGAASRPLRIEFCEGDVRALYDNWRRAVGFTPAAADERHVDVRSSNVEVDPEPASKRPSLTKHLDRSIDRLSRAGGHLDWPEALRDACDRLLQQLVALREQAQKARGAARDDLAARLPALEADLAASLRAHAPESLRLSLRQDAAAELAAYRSRLSAEAWERAIDVTTDRLLRDRLGLPVIDL